MMKDILSPKLRLTQLMLHNHDLQIGLVVRYALNNLGLKVHVRPKHILTENIHQEQGKNIIRNEAETAP